MPELTLVDAINLALARALTDDPNVVIFGEDVGVNGGVFRASRRSAIEIMGGQGGIGVLLDKRAIILRNADPSQCERVRRAGVQRATLISHPLARAHARAREKSLKNFASSSDAVVAG